ncbi:discoidin domain-containing protein [Micromonospora sp. MW-13]|uniref:discoidin domain-containing protein n=1 Tax=Micromonospora sp. MW-13 TaxID=2094022 RepID=UPI000E43CF41
MRGGRRPGVRDRAAGVRRTQNLTVTGAGRYARVRHRPGTASSTGGAGTPASAAVDGNTGTRWASLAADPQWLQVDLGASQSICRVVLRWAAAYARAFQIQTSAVALTPAPGRPTPPRRGRGGPGRPVRAGSRHRPDPAASGAG